MRLASDIALPAHAHVPTSGSVPDLAPLEVAKRLTPAVVSASDWETNVAYLYGHDLMRSGYYWEAHEVWEAVWQTARGNSPERLLLQALIQAANAHLKRKMGRPAAAGRLEIATEKLRAELLVRLGNGPDSFMGVDITNLNLHYIA